MARRASSAWWIENYGKPCIGADQVKLEWYPDVIGIAHQGTERIWQALGAIMLAYGYAVPTSYTGDYNCRQITGGGNWSGHAWPVAKDINAKTNPYINHSGRRRHDPRNRVDHSIRYPSTYLGGKIQQSKRCNALPASGHVERDSRRRASAQRVLRRWR